MQLGPATSSPSSSQAITDWIRTTTGARSRTYPSGLRSKPGSLHLSSPKRQVMQSAGLIP
ncbi:hypothetical protein TRIUR3_26053 [Triticum urartu]|uniref:Uncharacterized protein n=1 Tax=Triticum urartu TaxID=4572 RepID=M7ZHN7_TRIUA|nr:hypothetical protein TRIUR3_26053 [Triticum urartu]